MKYHRLFIPGGTYFFTVVTHHRKHIFQTPQAVDLLRETVRWVQTNHPFSIDAAVILPDHSHMIWTLPENDANYSTRWRLIKSKFTLEYQNISSDKQVWQNRFWEHFLRDDRDLANHINYIHYNPVKHGWVEKPEDWEYSSIHKFIREGVYPEAGPPEQIRQLVVRGDD